jgi:shikimate kinase
MGSGKTYWGKLWAVETGMSYYDLDDVIEKQEGMSVEAIFEKKSENYFREQESDLLRTMGKQEDCIISCGGGTPCFDANMQWMNENGTTVYLQANPVKLIENILLEIDKRPLLKKINKGEMLFFVEQKLKERDPFYTQAKITLSVKDLDVSSIRDIIQKSK